MRGHIDNRTYNPENDTIQMDGWLSATLHNTGDAELRVMGITVQSGESFVMGNSSTKLYTEIKLHWAENAEENKCNAVVHYIQEIANNC